MTGTAFPLKRVLLTGASGQLGRAMLSSAPPGVTIAAPGRQDCDLARPDTLAAIVRDAAPDLIVNAGAYTAVDAAESDPALAMTVNGEAVRAIAAAAREVGAQLVQVSTDFVFDGTQPRAWRPDDRRNPLSAYGRSKAAGEDGAGVDAIIVRTAWVHAAGGANFVRTMLRLMAQRDEVRVVADQIGAPTWASGLAEAIWGLARLGRPGIWHWTDAGTASWYDVAVAVGEEALARGMVPGQCRVVPISTADYPTPAARPAFSVLDCSATHDALGTVPRHWREGLRDMLDEESARG